MADIRNAINAGKQVTTHQSNISYHGWNGSGYIIVDPTTATGAYLIDGGANGANLFIMGALFLCMGGLIMSVNPIFGAALIAFGLGLLALGYSVWQQNKEACSVAMDLLIALATIAISALSFGGKAMIEVIATIKSRIEVVKKVSKMTSPINNTIYSIFIPLFTSKLISGYSNHVCGGLINGKK